MNFVTGTSRHQTYFATLDDQVSADNPVRLVDAFIDKLQLHKLGFTNTVQKSVSRPPYEPALLLKLYWYGYLNKIRSSRKLERECGRNIELLWLLKQLQPNYHTIADFTGLYSVSCVILFEFKLSTTISILSLNDKSSPIKKSSTVSVELATSASKSVIPLPWSTRIAVAPEFLCRGRHHLALASVSTSHTSQAHDLFNYTLVHRHFEQMVLATSARRALFLSHTIPMQTKRRQEQRVIE